VSRSCARASAFSLPLKSRVKRPRSPSARLAVCAASDCTVARVFFTRWFSSATSRPRRRSASSRSRPRRARSAAAPARARAAALASRTPRGTGGGASPRPSAAAPSDKASRGPAMRRACHKAASRPVSNRPPLTIAAVSKARRSGASIWALGTATTAVQPVPGTATWAARDGTPSCETVEKRGSPAAMAASEAGLPGRPTACSALMLRATRRPRPSTRTAIQSGGRRCSAKIRFSASTRKPMVRR
jgi:hypothetical protein